MPRSRAARASASSKASCAGSIVLVVACRSCPVVDRVDVVTPAQLYAVDDVQERVDIVHRGRARQHHRDRPRPLQRHAQRRLDLRSAAGRRARLCTRSPVASRAERYRIRQAASSSTCFDRSRCVSGDRREDQHRHHARPDQRRRGGRAHLVLGTASAVIATTSGSVVAESSANGGRSRRRQVAPVEQIHRQSAHDQKQRQEQRQAHQSAGAQHRVQVEGDSGGDEEDRNEEAEADRLELDVQLVLLLLPPTRPITTPAANAPRMMLSPNWSARYTIATSTKMAVRSAN